MTANPYTTNTVHEDRRGRQERSFGRFSRTVASLASYVLAATLGATASLNFARPSNSFAELLDVLRKQFFANWVEKVELAVFSLLTTILVHQLVRVALAGLLIRALTFGFVGGFLAMLMPATELIISDESPLRLLRWFARKPFWLYVALITCIQLLFELAIALIGRFYGDAHVGMDAKSRARIEQQ